MIDWSKLYSRAAALQSAGYTYREIADILTQEAGEKITRVAVKSAMRRQKFTRKDDALPDLPDRVKLETKSFAAASDFHVPYHSKTMINHMLAMMTRFDVDTLIINGDLSNQDQISDYPNNSPLQLPFHEEMMLCGDMLVSLDEELSKISRTPRLVITSGNHDERAAKRLGQDVRLEGLIYYMLAGRRLRSELILTSYDHCLINCDGAPWIIGHGNSFVRRPGDLAMRLAQKYRANVAVGHDHNLGFTSTPDGEFLAVSMGSMVDIGEKGTKLWYAERHLSTYPKVRNGFLLVKNGIPFLFDEYGSTALNGRRPWSFWYDVHLEDVFSE